ncbi:hypothetical protein CC79DRAFT_1265693, partial [Sarocladium strictum]
IMGPIRSNRATLVVLAAIIFLAAFVGLAYNNVESWDLPDANKKPNVDTAPEPEKEPETIPALPADIEDEEALRQWYIKHVMKPTIGVDQSPWSDFGAFQYELPEKKLWNKPLGKNFCIIDIDNRPWDKEGELWADKFMSWDQDRRQKVHGLSLGILNHWLYSKIHGYKYYFIDFVAPTDRRASWAKPAIIREILKHHDACVFMDSDAVIHHLDIPFEWLMNYWGLHPTTNSFALAFDPKHPNNEDQFGGVYLNTGFIVLQNNKKTYEILDAWEECPEPGGKHPDCVDFRTNRPGKPTDQGGFGTYIRYDFPAPDIISLPCTEANGFPESHSGCEGKFIQHLWTGKKNWIKILIGKQMPGQFLELFHKGFRADKPNFWIKEKDLKTLGEGKIGGSLAGDN